MHFEIGRVNKPLKIIIIFLMVLKWKMIILNDSGMILEQKNRILYGLET
jgi:hypothetical protein